MGFIEPNSERWLSLEDLPNEIWKDIKGYEGLYQISSYGRVKALEKINHRNNRCYPTYIMKVHTNTKKYLDIELSNGCVKNRFRIHRLVAQEFIPNLDDKPQVNHKDGNKKNNNVENLEWCNNSENQAHAFENGLNHREKLGDSPRAKRINQYSLTGKLIKKWDCAVRIKIEKGYSDGYICQCCKGKYKHAYGYIWRYNNE